MRKYFFTPEFRERNNSEVQFVGAGKYLREEFRQEAELAVNA